MPVLLLFFVFDGAKDAMVNACHGVMIAISIQGNNESREAETNAKE